MDEPIRWRIFYSDGTVVTDTDPAEVPTLDVQVIAYAHPNVGVALLTDRDYYWFEDGTWHAGDIFGLWDYLARPGWKRVLFGRTIPYEDYARIVSIAVEDMGKHAWLWDERKVEELL